ncbi:MULTISPECIES: DUF3800 domain-containing protein [Pseudomonas syringae group]|uniref:DUF3800 domain-containing protein n=1 Tax=Pseudomonas caricapapayae TaxID=46678 RepID=A0A0P9L1X8_9PSED|nr:MULTISPECIES: DUF3800 domain-containing protein [Pseudomonas syringae group]KPW63216.1 hypothetical protein ALO80_200108 [Pseudomonas caricapapayae]KPX32969.1 Uncharacterized protein ALO77_00740 [Pseudomonas coronafaciens pv. garcae]RMM06888.1 hypothetical protein ALQ84_200151 [Pseudomonas caricapapayae]RMV81993.1 hypothetical protein ALP02_02437 [Pseudomonas coronafaciens pv. garcae]RMW00162.1 hypothetical protein ALP01_200275 [Pseudomonas caricapapayae]
MTHYVAYLDEFGHVGQYVSRNHPKYKTHPAFGFAGLMLPATEIREFAIYFYKLKCQLLAWDLVNENPKNLPAYQWEKKGSQLYALRNVTKYEQLRRSTFRLLNHIEKTGGHVFYTGEHKTTDPDVHNSTETFKRQLLQSVRKIDRFCAHSGSTFMLLLDEQRAGNEWRETNVEVCTLAMFEDASEKCRTLIEPPIQAESHLFQTIQCADWICGLIGRLTALWLAPDEYSELEPFDKYFSARIAKVTMPGSGLEHQKTAEIPAELAGEAMPDAAGALAGGQ